MSKLGTKEITGVEIGVINHKDYPDYSDAYIQRAMWADTGLISFWLKF